MGLEGLRLDGWRTERLLATFQPSSLPDQAPELADGKGWRVGRLEDWRG